jgi:threonine synthase
LKDLSSGRIPVGSTVVCTLTGHGLKDSDIAIAQSSAPVLTVKAEKDSVREAIMGALA